MIKYKFSTAVISLFLVFGISALSVQTSAQGVKSLSNELIWASGEFRSEWVSGLNSMEDGIHYSTLEMDAEGSKVVKYAYKTGEKVAVLLESSVVFKGENTQIEGYQFSADEQKVLIQTEAESIYRHSSKANYYLYDFQTRETTALTDFEKGKQRLATFSPDGKNVAFVRDNNIFIYNCQRQVEQQVSFDGKMNAIINGATDWVYEEEFGFDNGLYWSPEGNRLAYYRFDESEVKEFQMAIYGTLYPEQYTFKYPKAGEDNAKVSVHIYDLEDESSTPVDLPNDIEYVPRIKWSQDNDGLCVMTLNRHQNDLVFLLTDFSQKAALIPVTSIYHEKSETYIEINDNLIFQNDGKHFLWNSEKDGFNHIYQINMEHGDARQITKGNWEVIEFIGADEAKAVIYYTSSEVSPLEEHLYVQALSGGKAKKLSTRSGRNSADFSKSYSYFINYHSDANTPFYISLHDRKGKEIRVLKDNADLKNTLAEYDLPKKEFFNFKNSEGIDLHCSMIKPKDFDPARQYPVYVNIYGGPGQNTVTDSWGYSTYLWHQYLAQEGYIVVSCDPRGTMYRGRDFKHATYQQLGKLETEDFIDLAKYLAALSYIDGGRIGIQGWSYGGYMTSLCMTKGAEYFKMGIAVAPVTNWRFYDSIYTERFMQTPQENAAGYDDNSPINHVKELKNPYLLIHGSADDNVHYQNSMEMVSALVSANKDFDMFIYPNKNHGIYGGITRLHLFNKMTRFTLENL